MTIQYVNFPSYKPWTGVAGGDAPPPPALPALNQPPAPPVPGAPAVSPPGQGAANQPQTPDSVPAPNGVVAPDNWIPQQPAANNGQQPALNQQPAAFPPGYNGQMPPGYPAAPQTGFSGMRAAGHFFKGFFNEGIDMVKGAIQHPIQTAAMMAAGAAACFFLPWAGTAMTVAFALFGAYKMFKGYQASKADRAAGNFAQAEADFDTVGRGGFELALAIGPALFQKWLNKVRGQGPHVGSSDAPSGRGGRAAKTPKTPKTPRVRKTPAAVDPAPVEPTVEPASVDPKPVKVRTRTPKPATEVTTTASKAGRAHVGYNKAAGGSAQEAHVGSAPKVRKTVVKKPVVEKPVVDQPVVKKPVVEKPVVDKPVVEKPVKKPVVRKPSVRKAKVTTDKPATEVTTIGDKPKTGRAHVGSNKAAGGSSQEGHVGSAPAKKVKVKRAAPRRAKADKAVSTDDQTLRTVKGRLKAAMKEIDRLLAD